MPNIIERVKIEFEKMTGNNNHTNDKQDVENIELNPTKTSNIDIVGQEKTTDGSIGIINKDAQPAIHYTKEGSSNKEIKVAVNQKINSFNYDKDNNCINITLANGDIKTIDVSDMEEAIKTAKKQGKEPIIFPKPPGEITVSNIENCKTREEFLALVMPWYEYYCKVYGLKYPGALALQGIYETGVPNNIAPSLRNDNNMGGLKYYEGNAIPNVIGPGTPSPASEGSVPYCAFENINDYIEAQVWNVTYGEGYEAARAANTMEDFITSAIAPWTGGAPEDDYSGYIINDYYKYGLNQYEKK